MDTRAPAYWGTPVWFVKPTSTSAPLTRASIAVSASTASTALRVIAFRVTPAVYVKPTLTSAPLVPA